MPNQPQSIDELLKYTRQLEPWINDNFGFRAQLVRLNNKLRHTLFGQFPSIQVISGKKGRIFLSSHATTLPEYSAIRITCGDTPTSQEKVAEQLNSIHDSFQREGIDARIMIVPSSPVIYPESLPSWLETRCNAAQPPVDAVLASAYLKADTKEAIFYPKTEMLTLKKDFSVFPKTWFHWAGAGPREVAGLSTEFFWGIPHQTGTPLAEQTDRMSSDISNLFPGINLASQIENPEYAKSHIDACLGPQCFPSLGSIADKLQDVAFYRNPAAQQDKLIILSDSFGKFIAGWYSRYFKEVIHLSTNSLSRLDAPETKQLKDFLSTQARTGHLLLLYHDGSVLWDRPAQDQKELFKIISQ